MRASGGRFVGLSWRICVVFRNVGVHVIPGLRALDENVRLGPKPARVIQGADPDPDEIGSRRDLQKQHATAFRAERSGNLIAAIAALDVALRLAAGDPEARRGNPHRGGIRTAALPLAVMAVTE